MLAARRMMNMASDPCHGLPIHDTAIRANSTTTANPRSDGCLWTLDDPGVAVWGINSNRIYLATASATAHWYGIELLHADAAVPSVDVAVTNTSAQLFSNTSAVVFAYNPTDLSAYFLHLFPVGTTSFWLRKVNSSGTFSNLATYTITDPGSSPTRYRATYDESTGVIETFFAGSSLGTVTDGSPLTGTHVGFGASIANSDSWSAFDAVAYP
jgi:hypothetical protein